MLIPHEINEKRKTTCIYCNTAELMWSWDRNKKRRILYETLGDKRGYEHECEGRDIRQAKCRFCGAQDLLWIRRGYDKFELTESYGLPHVCPEMKKYNKDHKEALRLDYAFEKKWINSIEDNYECPKCDGLGYRIRKPYVYKKCKKCKGIGTFSPAKKKNYLKTLRKRYWPFNGAWMKWKKTET